VDDIQFIAGKESTQEEFFHTFNTLHGQNKQIIVSSDRPPKSLITLEERLRSRFEWGLTADIQLPDLETRLAILRSKSERLGQSVPAEIMDLIAHRVQSNIRELEGYLRRVVAFASLKGEIIDLDLAKDALKDLLDSSARLVTVEKIQKLICHKYKLKLTQLKSKNNSPVVAFPRQVAMYLSKEMTPSSLPEIGKKFGGKHHTTVLHSIRKIEKMREENPDFDKEINSLIGFVQ